MFDWGPHIIFVAPNWVAYEHTVSIDAVVFIYSVHVVQEKLDFCREQKAECEPHLPDRNRQPVTIQ